MKSRLINFIAATLITVILAIIIVVGYSYSPNRVFLLLGGDMPHGLIQMFTYFMFIYAMLETMRFDKWANHQKDAFKLNVLPEKEQFVLSADEVNDIKLKTVSLQSNNDYLLLDMIKKACTKFRSNKNVHEALQIVNTQTENNFRNSDTEQNIIKYFAWAIQSLGLIGTVMGIGASMYAVNQVADQAGIEQVTRLLSFAFDTTLIALVLSVILLYYYHIVAERVDKLHSDNEQYVIENLINRIYAK